ncbi:protein phosphatase 1 [Ostreococcus tauri]|uniref:Protein phosphatase 1 n=1 Tax=Ostreococcus tauri TaxID=70448 RepID=A0A1Y5HZW5_OSTTA|nr:protein phosphatase 1 [Ostreococcus tauri]
MSEDGTSSGDRANSNDANAIDADGDVCVEAMETMEFFMGDASPASGTLTGLVDRASATLTTLRVVRCRAVKNMRGLEVCKRLRSLTVAECALTSLAGASSCRALEELYVYGNHIDSLEELQNGCFERLRTLWLNDNRLRALDGVEFLRSLQHLNVAQNLLERVPDGTTTSALEHLNIAGNPIRSLSDIAIATRRQQAEEEHSGRRTWFNLQCVRLREAYRRARDDALEHLSSITNPIEHELFNARAHGSRSDADRALVKLNEREQGFFTHEDRARESLERTIAQVFRDAEILAETVREERFRFTEAADITFSDVYENFKERWPSTVFRAERLLQSFHDLSNVVIASNVVELNLHATGLVEIPHKLNECSRLETLVLSNNSIKRLNNLPRSETLRHLDFGNNKLWNSADINVLTACVMNASSIVLRGNCKWLAETKFYAPILVKSMPRLLVLDGVEITTDVRAKHMKTECTLDASAVRRRGRSHVVASKGRSMRIEEFSLECESLRRTKMCEKFETVRVAHVAHNCLRSIKGFGVCRQLRHLCIEGNKLVRLDGLSLLRELRYLNIKNCGVKKLNPAWFISLSELRCVNVEENALKTISVLKQCSELCEIYAARNKLTDVHGVLSLASLQHLRLLSLQGNAVSTSNGYPHHVIFKFPQINILDTDYINSELRSEAVKMYTGRLTEDMIPTGQSACAHKVNLSGLNLLHLDGAIAKAHFQGMKQIKLDNNSLHDVSALGNLPCLTKLELRNNRINTVFGRFGFFAKLEFLDLSGNYISSLSVLSLGCCSNLRTLLLCDNFLTRLDGITQLKSLRVLKADKNKLNRIDSSTFVGCDALRLLSLRKNAFRTLKHLSKLVSVRELRLDGNRVDDIEEISWLAWLPRLRILSLGGNKIASECDRYVEFTIMCCRGLKRLDGESVLKS